MGLDMGRSGERRMESEKLLLRTFGSIETASLLPVLHTFRIQDSPDDVVADSREVFHTSSADEHNRVFLEVVAFSHDVGIHLMAVRQAHTGNFPESGVRLLWRQRKSV